MKQRAGLCVDPLPKQAASVFYALGTGNPGSEVYLQALREDHAVPKLIRLYIVNVLIGFALALGFVVALVALDVAHLRHLILETSSGPLAFVLLVVSNGIVFAGVQFGIAVMRLAGDEPGPRGGRRAPVATNIPVRIESTAGRGSARS
jgi:hypothetical protein